MDCSTSLDYPHATLSSSTPEHQMDYPMATFPPLSPVNQPPSNCYFRTSSLPKLYPIDLSADIPLPPVNDSLEVSDLKLDMFDGISSDNTLLFQTSPFTSDNNSHISDLLLPQLENLTLTETSDSLPGYNRPPTPRPQHRTRQGRASARTMSAEQKCMVDTLVGRKKVRFCSGSERNELARKVGVPASQLFSNFGRKLDL